MLVIGPSEMRVKMSLMMASVKDGVRTIMLARKSSAALPSGLNGIAGGAGGAAMGDDGMVACDATSTESTSTSMACGASSSSLTAAASVGDEQASSVKADPCDCSCTILSWVRRQRPT